MSSIEEYDLMRFLRMLQTAGPYSSVLKAIQRVFQKVPHLVSEVLETMEEEGFEDVGNPGQRQGPAAKSRLVELTVEKVKEICTDTDVSQSLGMSSDINSYIAFLDVVLVKLKADSSAKKWSVFLLLDYPTRNDEPVPIDDEGYTLRTKLKKEIKGQDYHASVQADVDSDRIWLRVAAVKKTKNRVKDNQNLKKTSPVYIAYYPGEPYYYMTGRRAGEVVRQAMVTALGCQGDRLLSLEGKSVSSLRMMRLGRDGRDGPSIKARPENDRFTIFNSEDSQEETEPSPHPILDSAKIEFSAPVEEYGLSLDCRVEIFGSDVIGGLMDMVDDGLICEPAPAWVTNLSTAGRNSFKLNSAGGVEVGVGRRQQLDTQSVLSTATFMSIN